MIVSGKHLPDNTVLTLKMEAAVIVQSGRENINLPVRGAGPVGGAPGLQTRKLRLRGQLRAQGHRVS